jgi:hypothetical protein
MRYVKDRAKRDGYDWRRENDRFGALYNAYAEAYAAGHANDRDRKCPSLVREEYYRLGMHKEFEPR